MTTIIIADEGGYGQQRYRTNSVDRSWAVGASGTLNAEMITADLVRDGIADARGKWIWCESDDAGLWGGVVTDSNGNDDGTTEIIGTEFGTALFSKRLLPIEDTPIYGPAGAVALQAIVRTEREGHLYILDRTADEYGEPVQLTVNGQELIDALHTVESASGQEWQVDPETFAFSWGRTGYDKTGSIQLVHPRHIVGYSFPKSIEPVINQLRSSIADSQSTRSQMIVTENPESINQIGVRQGSYEFKNDGSLAAFKPAAQAIVDELCKQGLAIECRIVNKDRCWSWFREGDDLCILLPQDSSQLDVRIMARSLSDDDQVMSVSATVSTWTVFA